MVDPHPSEHWSRASERSPDPEDPDATLRIDPEDLDRTVTLAGGDEPSTRAAPATPTTGSASRLDSWHGESGHSSPARTRFVPQATIGRGGMGEVLLAWQPELARDVAVKILRDDRRGAALLDALRSEAGISGRLDHPNVVPVHDAGLDYLVMRHVRGETFSDYLRGDPPLSESIEVLRKICDAVAYAHDRGVIHRDLKPSNVMVGGFGQVLVMDWGLALELPRRDDGSLGPPDIPPEVAAAGTPSYLAPEMARGQVERIGTASDVYLLGAILYRILCGRPPHLGPLVSTVIAAAAVNDYRRLGEVGSDLPRRLIELQERAMATDPAERPDVIELRDGLVGWLRSIDSEREAMTAAGRGHRRLAEASTARDARVSYREFARSLAAFEQALAAWEGCIPAAEGRRMAHDRYTRAAIRNGDLTLAASIAAAAERDDLSSEVRAAIRGRLRTRLTAVATRLALGCLTIAVVVGTATFALYAAGSEDRETQRRQREAMNLVTESSPEADIEVALQERVGRAYRAMGLAGETTAVRAAALTAVRDYARWARDQQRWDLASALIADAVDLSPEDEEAESLRREIEREANAEARRRTLLVADRRERLRELGDHAREYTEYPLWRERAAAEILSWDGDELRPDVVSLLDDDSVLVRRLAANVIGRHPSWKAGPELLAMLFDGNALDQEQAWLSLTRLSDERTRDGMRRYLLELEDVDRARELAVGLPAELIPPVREPTDDPQDIRAYARERLVYNDAASYVDEMNRLDELTPDELATLYHVTRWQLGDTNAAERYGRGLLELNSDDRLARAWLVDLALARGDLASAEELLEQAAGTAGEATHDPLAIRRLRLLLANGKDTAANALGEAIVDRLVDMPPSERELAVAANALLAVGRTRGGRRLYAAGDRYWHDSLQQMRELDAHEQHLQARDLARLTLARFGPHREALHQLGRSELALGDVTAAARAETGLLSAIPDDELGWRLRTDRLAREGRLQSALEAADQLVAVTANNKRRFALERVVVLARLCGQSKHLHRALAELAQLAVIPRHRWQMTRMLCEEGFPALAIDLLWGRLDTVEYEMGEVRISDTGEPALRLAWEQFAIGIPKLRREGWDGTRGNHLAGLLLDEAMVNLEHPDGEAARASDFARHAHRHAEDGSLHRAVASLILAVAADERREAQALSSELLSLPPVTLAELPWLPARLEHLRDRLENDGPILPLDPPGLAEHDPWSQWPRRPLPDVALTAEQARALAELWGGKYGHMPPPRFWPLERLYDWAGHVHKQRMAAPDLEAIGVPLTMDPGPSWDDLSPSDENQP